MAWSTLPSYSDGNILTAAQLTAIKDNINETAPAKATATGRIFVSTGANAIAERIPTSLITSGGAQGTTSTSFVDLTTVGPTLSSVATGTSAFYGVSSYVLSTGTGAGAYMAVAVSGATTIAATTTKALRFISEVANSNQKASYVSMFSSGMGNALTAGNNTFQAKYASTSGASTATFDEREIWVIPF